MKTPPFLKITKLYLITSIVFILIVFSVSLIKNVNTNKENCPNQVKTIFNSGNEGCNGSVLDRIDSLGNRIISNKYVGNGRFEVMYLDVRRGYVVRAIITTDSECKINSAEIIEIVH